MSATRPIRRSTELLDKATAFYSLKDEFGEAANVVLAGRATPGLPVPTTFRLLVEADIPALAIAKTTGLQTALDGKAASSHAHSGPDITSGTVANARTTGTAANTADTLMLRSSQKIAGLSRLELQYSDNAGTSGGSIHLGDTGHAAGDVRMSTYMTPVTFDSWPQYDIYLFRISGVDGAQKGDLYAEHVETDYINTIEQYTCYEREMDPLSVASVSTVNNTVTLASTSHAFPDRTQVKFGANPPAPLVAGTRYYVRDTDDAGTAFGTRTPTFKLAATFNGAAIDLTTSGTSPTIYISMRQARHEGMYINRSTAEAVRRYTYISDFAVFPRDLDVAAADVSAAVFRLNGTIRAHVNLPMRLFQTLEVGLNGTAETGIDAYGAANNAIVVNGGLNKTAGVYLISHGNRAGGIFESTAALYLAEAGGGGLANYDDATLSAAAALRIVGLNVSANGTLTFANTKGVYGLTTGGASRNLANIGADNVIYIGDNTTSTQQWSLAGPTGSWTWYNDGTRMTLSAAGALVAASFSGSGASLTALNADNISSGTLANARTTGTNLATASTLALRDSNADCAFRNVTMEKAIASKAVSHGVAALTDAATIATDAALGNLFTVTLGGNRTLGAPTNPTSGQRCTWRLKQDGTGSRTLTLTTGSAGAFRFGTDITAITLTTTASKTDYLTAIYNAADDRWDVVAFVKGY